MPTLIEIKDLESTLMLCQELKLSFLELNMNLPQYQIEAFKNSKYFSDMGHKYNIAFTIHLDENLNVCDFNKDVSSAYIKTVINAIAAAKEQNVSVLNMHMNHGVHFTLPNRKVQLFEQYNEYYMNAVKNFRSICEHEIGSSNIKICIENTDGFKIFEKQAIEYLLESNVFALTWDIGHSHSSNNIDEAFIMANQKKLNHFHIHDSSGTKDHMTLGTGKIDLKKYLAVAQHNNCRCVIETKTIDSLRQSVSWLKKNNYM